MSGITKIEWCDRVWNPVTGCTKVSQGCKNCYAEGIARRFWGERKFGNVQCHPERLEDISHWRKPARVFVNSMSDLFHPDVPDEFIAQVWNVMASSNQHTFMILTKRADRMLSFLSRCANWGGWITHNGAAPAQAYRGDGIVVGITKAWPLQNVWLGVSVENREAADERIPLLLKTPAAVRFVSCEPLLGSVNLDKYDSELDIHFLTGLDCNYPEEGCLGGIDWVICGGESGPNARPMHPDWARGLRDQCQAAGVPFFFKQWGEWYPDNPIYGDTDSAVNFDDVYERECYGAKHEIALENTGSIPVKTIGHDVQVHWQPDPNKNPWHLAKIGKKAAGRLLDGREWNEFPEASA